MRSTTRCLRFEPLEDRALLNVGPAGLEHAVAVQSLDDFAVLPGRLGHEIVDQCGETRAEPDQLTVGGYVVAPQRAEDYYSYFKERMPLFRSLEEVAIELKGDASLETFLSQLSTAQGEASRLVLTTHVNPRSSVYRLHPSEGTIGDLDDVMASLESLDSVQWAMPVFVEPTSGLRQIMTNEIFVSLEEGVDPSAFFADSRVTGYHLYMSYRHNFYGENQFKVTFAGNPLEALEVANSWAQDSRSGGAWLNAFIEIRFGIEPNPEPITISPSPTTQQTEIGYQDGTTPDAGLIQRNGTSDIGAYELQAALLADQVGRGEVDVARLGMPTVYDVLDVTMDVWRQDRGLYEPPAVDLVVFGDLAANQLGPANTSAVDRESHDAAGIGWQAGVDQVLAEEDKGDGSLFGKDSRPLYSIFTRFFAGL